MTIPPYDTYTWLQVVTLGGVMGATGQGVRTIVGMKKLGDAAAAQGLDRSDLLSVSQLVISLAIGFIAGALAGITVITNPKDISIEQILGIAAAGYAGADFIEGFMSRIAPANPSGNTATTPKPAESAGTEDEYAG